jgi:hypothetical protein
MANCPHYWGNGAMLILNVQIMEIVEIISAPFREGFLSADGVFHPLAGCYYSLAGSFEANPAVAGRKFGMAVLSAVVETNEFPKHLIEGGPQIVDSICYYKGDIWRQILDKSNSDTLDAPFWIGMDFSSMWLTQKKGISLPFEFRDMMIGPVDFLFGSSEHAEVSR